jgi:hypothetical protein
MSDAGSATQSEQLKGSFLLTKPQGSLDYLVRIGSEVVEDLCCLDGFEIPGGCENKGKINWGLTVIPSDMQELSFAPLSEATRCEVLTIEKRLHLRLLASTASLENVPAGAVSLIGLMNTILYGIAAKKQSEEEATEVTAVSRTRLISRLYLR